MKKMKKETQLLLPLTACNVWMSWPTSWRGQGGTTTGATEPPLGGNWEDICKAGTCHYQIGWRTKVQDLLWCSSGMQALTTSNQLKNKRRKEGRKGYQPLVTPWLVPRFSRFWHDWLVHEGWKLVRPGNTLPRSPNWEHWAKKVQSQNW